MMMTTKIYQFHLTQEDKDLLNEKGWGASDRTLAYADKGIGNIDLNQWFHAYDHVATVDATDLDEVFRLTNLWEKPELVQKHAQMTSVSVGDVLEMDGQFYLVANFGFEPINIERAA
jgi:hypothetical protein